MSSSQSRQQVCLPFPTPPQHNHNHHCKPQLPTKQDNICVMYLLEDIVL